MSMVTVLFKDIFNKCSLQTFVRGRLFANAVRGMHKQWQTIAHCGHNGPNCENWKLLKSAAKTALKEKGRVGSVNAAKRKVSKDAARC